MCKKLRAYCGNTAKIYNIKILPNRISDKHLTEIKGRRICDYIWMLYRASPDIHRVKRLSDSKCE